MALAAALPAASTVTLLTEDDGTLDAHTIRAFIGDNDSEPRGLARLSSGSYVYFETNDLAGAAQDSLILFDPDAAGGGAARFSVLASEAVLLGSDPTFTDITGNAACFSIAVDPDTDDIYTPLINRSPLPDEHALIRIPCTGGLGSDVFGVPEVVANSDTFIDDNDENHQVLVDHRPEPNEIILLLDTGALEDGTTNGLYRRALSAAPSDGNTLIASYVQLAAGTTPPSVIGFNRFGITGVALRGREDYLLFNGNGDANADGDVVLWDVSAGSASTLVENTTMANGICPLVSLNNGDFALFAVDGAVGGATTAEHLWRIDGDTGAVVRQIATDAEITAAISNGTADMAIIGGSLATDGNLIFTLFLDSSFESLIEIIDTAGEVDQAGLLTR